MKILVLSQFGEIVDVCRRMVEEGHNVDLFIRDKELQYIGLGFVNKISEVRPTLSKLTILGVFIPAKFIIL